MSRQVHVVPHTHWDREWYLPYQSFRLKLVDLVDGLLPLLERDPSYAHYMLDGQMAVLDDYLEIRPENAGRIRRLAAQGRLSVGPWYILMDEFLVSGETMVRDLQLGLAKAAEFGGAMPVGYLPDMFGHIAQMPQLLQQFGFDDTVVWRGTPAAVADRPAFRWEAPDGSAVRAQYLPRGYGNGAHLPLDGKDLLEQVERFIAEEGTRAGGGDEPLLWMNGTDHLQPQASLGRLVAEANGVQDDLDFTVSSLAAFVAAAPRDGLPVWRGELRSGARANVLMGVASNRVDVKQLAARAERALEQVAEPLSALYLDAVRWPQAFLDVAWKLIIQNSAHDSICACSVDEVVDAVVHRFHEAIRIADGLTERAVLGVARVAAEAVGSGGSTLDDVPALGGAAPVAINGSSRTRGGLVTFKLPPGAELPGTQVLHERPGSVQITALTPAEAVDFVAVIVENIGDAHRIDLETNDDGSVDARLRIDPRRFGLLDPAPAREAFAALAERDPEAEVRVWMDFTPRRVVLAHVDDIPGFGWARWVPGAPSVEPVHADDHRLGNGIVEVEIADDGTFSVNGHGGLGRLVDDGDKGDTYNWCPPADDTVVDRPESVEVTVVEAGPLRARVAIDATYRWPGRVVGERRVGVTEVVVRTSLELHAGDDLVRVSVAFDNRSRDHRLRAWFPLPEPARASRAECAFAVVERGLVAEGGPTEVGLATFPNRRFVEAGGLTIAHEGLLEYELVDLRGTDDDARAHALALTLVRCTGLLSQGPMATRPLPAGPITAMEGPQLQRPVELRYAVHVGGRDPYAVTDDAFLPLVGVGGIATTDLGSTDGAPGAGPGAQPDAAIAADGSRGTRLTVEGAEVSAVRRVEGGQLEVRVFNPTDATTTVHVPMRQGWLVDLRGRPGADFEGRFELRPWGIQTFRLRA